RRADVVELRKERAAAAPPTNGRQAPFEPVANGDHAADHGPRGRFVRGNRAAAGRSCARRVAALRSALLDAVSPATLKRLVKKLVAPALAGDLDAARLVLLYAVGQPAEAVDPHKVGAA